MPKKKSDPFDGLLEFRCPGCDRAFQVPARQAAQANTLVCPHCAKESELEEMRAYLRRRADEAAASFQAVKPALAKIGPKKGA